MKLLARNSLARGHVRPVCVALIACLGSFARPSTARADGPPIAPELAPPESPRVGPTPEAAAPVRANVANEPVEALPGAHPSKVAAFIFGGVALVGLGVGAGFGVAALHESSQFDPRRSSASAASLGNEHALLSDVGFGAAVVAGVTSAVLFFKHDDGDPQKPPGELRVTVSPTATPHGAGARVAVRF